MSENIMPTKRLRGIARLRDAEATFTLTNDEAAVLVQRGVSGLAQYFKVSPRTLRRVCAKTGVSLRALRAVLIVTSARTLLRTRLPIMDVAHRLGFSSSQTFARFLRRECGTTARELRSGADPAVLRSLHGKDR